MIPTNDRYSRFTLNKSTFETTQSFKKPPEVYLLTDYLIPNTITETYFFKYDFCIWRYFYVFLHPALSVCWQHTIR